MDLTDPTSTALLAFEALEAVGIRTALYGGLMLAAYGDARETRDADLAVLEVGAERATLALRARGLDAASTFDDMIFGGLRLSRVTLIASGEDTGLNTVDLVRPRSERLAAGVLDRALTAPLRDRTIRVVAPEDFILLKILSTRERDLDDAASVWRRLSGELDGALIAREIDLLKAEVSDFGVGGRYEEVMRRSQQPL